MAPEIRGRRVDTGSPWASIRRTVPNSPLWVIEPGLMCDTLPRNPVCVHTENSEPLLRMEAVSDIFSAHARMRGRWRSAGGQAIRCQAALWPAEGRALTWTVCSRAAEAAGSAEMTSRAHELTRNLMSSQ